MLVATLAIGAQAQESRDYKIYNILEEGSEANQLYILGDNYFYGDGNMDYLLEVIDIDFNSVKMISLFETEQKVAEIMASINQEVGSVMAVTYVILNNEVKIDASKISKYRVK